MMRARRAPLRRDNPEPSFPDSVIVAPMAGVTDQPFETCVGHGVRV